MFLTIKTTHRPATDLGYLLHKHPARVQVFEVSGGRAHVFYPSAGEDVCQIVLLLELDRTETPRGRPEFTALSGDRAYTANSFLSTAISGVFSSALNGRCAERPELVDTPLPLVAEFSALRVIGGYEVLRRVFEPLGYTLSAQPIPLDPQTPARGPSPYWALRLEHTLPLRELLRHLYLLLPVFDYEKHYWTTRTDLDVLFAKGGQWLQRHPERAWITRRYLRHGRRLVDAALARLAPEEALTAPLLADDERETGAVTPANAADDSRSDAVIRELKQSEAVSVIDLGCGDGRLLERLQTEAQFQRLAGIDVSFRQIEAARRRLLSDEARPRAHERINLFQSSLLYRDQRLAGFDAAVLVDLLEYFDPERLPTVEQNVFGFAQARTVIVSTPNAEYPGQLDELGLASPASRPEEAPHFCWTRDEFEHWCENVAAAYGYAVRYFDVGPVNVVLGAATQLAVFSKL